MFPQCSSTIVLHKYNPIHNHTDDHFPVEYLSKIFFISKFENQDQLSSISIIIESFFCLHPKNI